MAISGKQLEYALRNLNMLIPDLVEFGSRHGEVDTKAVRDGSFDLKTTIEATFEAYKWQIWGAKESGLTTYEKTIGIVHKTAANDMHSAYFNALKIIEDKVLYCTDVRIENETVTTDRMRETLYDKWSPIHTP